MKALFYADWCTIRETFARTVLVCAIVAVPMVAASYTDGSDAPGVFAATIVTVMPIFYFMLGLFGADEQAGWQEVRLALPVTPSSVVRARYAFLALAGFGAALVGTLCGLLTNVLFSAFAKLMVPRGVFTIAASALGVAAFGLAYMALLMPMAFKIGISKARVYFTLPFFIPLLLNVPPVRDAFAGMTSQLEHMSDAMGTPLPLLAAGFLVCVAIYLVSMRVSERVYAARDF